VQERVDVDVAQSERAAGNVELSISHWWSV
jgi:hypothetical protein